ncbi:MAG TPA: NUDIX domain-containing protein [Acidimicrobiales bacterium]|nr:NUDIX domain-containing protein [Acidimicrobiales bacterium]
MSRALGAVAAGGYGLALRLYRRLPRRARLFVVHHTHPSFTVGAISVIERSDGALLLVRHSYRRAWGFPGGLLKRGEDVAAGARREAMEEVAIEIELLGEPAVVVDPGPRRVDVVFRARPVADPSGAHADSAEIVELAWFPPDALPRLQHEAADALVALARASGRPVSVPTAPPTGHEARPERRDAASP